MSYDLTGPLDFDALGSVRPGSNILLSGPAMTGRSDLAFSMLAGGSREGEGAIVMTTGDPADDVLADYRNRVENLDESRVAVVDCRGEGGRDSEHMPDGAYVHHVSSPGDLTGIGMRFSDVCVDFRGDDIERVRTGLFSLSTLLSFGDLRTVSRFVHTLVGRIDSVGGLGVFLLDPASHDERAPHRTA